MIRRLNDLDLKLLEELRPTLDDHTENITSCQEAIALLESILSNVEASRGAALKELKLLRNIERTLKEQIDLLKKMDSADLSDKSHSSLLHFLHLSGENTTFDLFNTGERMRVLLRYLERSAQQIYALHSSLDVTRDHLRTHTLLRHPIQSVFIAREELCRATRRLLQPINSIPAEVWSIIFCAVAEDEFKQHITNLEYKQPTLPPSSAFTICQVCSFWRMAALATPHMWRFIHVENGGLHRHRQQEHYATIRADRSGRTPLEIAVHGDSRYWNEAGDACLAFLWFREISKVYVFFAERIFLASLRIGQLEFADIRIFRSSVGWDGGMLNAAPYSMRSARLINVYPRLGYTTNLRRLILEADPLTGTNHLADLLNTLYFTPQLRTLAVLGWSHARSADLPQLPTIPLHHLMCLHVEWSKFQEITALLSDHAVVPKLKRLSLYFTFERRNIPITVNVIANQITDLVLIMFRPLDREQAASILSVFPNVRSLALSNESRGGSIVSVMELLIPKSGQMFLVMLEKLRVDGYPGDGYLILEIVLRRVLLSRSTSSLDITAGVYLARFPSTGR